MKHLIPCLAALLLASCAAGTAEQAPQPPAAPPPPPPPPPALTESVGLAGHAAARCPLTIAFGSYAMGIDTATRARVEALLIGDRAVTGFDAHPWGREGEVTLCVRTRAPADAARLFEAIRLIVPSRPRGPISLSTPAGLRYETPPPR